MSKRPQPAGADYAELAARMEAGDFGTTEHARLATAEEEAELDAAWPRPTRAASTSRSRHPRHPPGQ